MVDGIKYGGDLSAKAKKELDLRVQAAQAASNILSKKLSEAVKFDSETAWDIQFEMLFGEDAILACHVAAALKMKRCQRPSLQEIFALTKTADISKPISELVYVRSLHKGNGKHRFICSFGIQHRAAQEICRRAMAPFFVPKRFQCIGPEGYHAAVAKTLARLEAGFDHACVLDIVHCFQSFDEARLVEILPLPDAVVRNVALGDTMAMRVGHQGLPSGISRSYALQQARQGIPQGSCHSPHIQAFTVSKLTWSKECVLMQNYADDFALLAMSGAMLTDAREELGERVRKLPGGHFELATKSEGTLQSGFRFLGHDFIEKDGKIQALMPPSAWHKIVSKLNKLDDEFADLLSKKHDPLGAKKILIKQLAVVRGYEQSYKSCSNLARYLEPLFITIEDNAKLVGVNLKELEIMAKPLIDRYHVYTNSLS
ncbi:hypothetical protein NK718_15470 [Alsobacter sp. SYSU M60028]|uniref:Reverse transcriptase domain-containing protein n=1 Tax=Alsobacter ponti TaxID=2962936 RepID=A0ABT1LEJ8_9HYPH|nr:hypothetical protein [Alsobacter ponti]MCP8939925.1 hypothetical protein [Alsobacter ponti]